MFLVCSMIFYVLLYITFCGGVSSCLVFDWAMLSLAVLCFQSIVSVISITCSPNPHVSFVLLVSFCKTLFHGQAFSGCFLLNKVLFFIFVVCTRFRFPAKCVMISEIMVWRYRSQKLFSPVCFCVGVFGLLLLTEIQQDTGSGSHCAGETQRDQCMYVSTRWSSFSSLWIIGTV